ncbi:hypothetical protein Tco_0093033 [Tanacetum coccineum]
MVRNASHVDVIKKLFYVNGFIKIGVDISKPFQPTPTALLLSLVGGMANPFAVSHPSASTSPLGQSSKYLLTCRVQRPESWSKHTSPLQVLKYYSDNVTDEGLLRMLKVIKKDLKPARRQETDSEDDDDDTDDADLLDIEEEKDFDEVEIGDNTGDGYEQSEDSKGTIVKEPREENSDEDSNGKPQVLKDLRSELIDEEPEIVDPDDLDEVIPPGDEPKTTLKLGNQVWTRSKKELRRFMMSHDLPKLVLVKEKPKPTAPQAQSLISDVQGASFEWKTHVELIEGLSLLYYTHLLPSEKSQNVPREEGESGNSCRLLPPGYQRTNELFSANVVESGKAMPCSATSYHLRLKASANGSLKNICV